MPQIVSDNKQNTVINTFKETVEQLVIAFILAFVFRAFVVEAFVIPTGSMADTLRGAHFRLTCPRCSYDYNFGFTASRHIAGASRMADMEGYVPNKPLSVVPRYGSGIRNGIPICPMCGTAAGSEHLYRVSNGDRILVLKYLYQFFEPKRWDVVVFKNPTDPTKNFIKRLIGRAGEKVEIIDGDIYINDLIQAKPPKVQDTLWLAVYDSDYQPADGHLRYPWREPFIAEDASSDVWTIEQQSRRLTFGGSAQPADLNFNPARLRYVSQNFCAYNGPSGDDRSVSRDLKMSFRLTCSAESGEVAVKLGKYDRVYCGHIGFDGLCKIVDTSSGAVLLQEQLDPLLPNEPIDVSFANIDHRLIIELGDRQLTYIGPNDPESWGYDRQARRFTPPSAALSGRGGSFSLEHITLHRDIHYANYVGNSLPGLGTENHPILLEQDQFYVLGDNSPHSQDSRFWDGPGVGRDGVTAEYRQGIVPRDYLIGKALLVYWPAGFHLYQTMPIALIPNCGQMRFIR